MIHGDCLEVMCKIPDNCVNLVLVDLPYAQTLHDWDVLIPFEPLWEQYKRIAKENAAFVFTTKGQFMINLILSNRDWYRYELVWNKGKASNFTHCHNRPLISHEFVIIFYNKLPTYNPQMTQGKAYTHHIPNDIVKGITQGMARSTTTVCDGSRYPKSIIEVTGHSQRGLVHPTQKPLRLMEYLVKMYSNEGDVVLDNCMGSGTTGVAALSCGRKFIGIEKDLEYYKIASKRIHSVPKASLF